MAVFLLALCFAGCLLDWRVQAPTASKLGLDYLDFLDWLVRVCFAGYRLSPGFARVRSLVDFLHPNKSFPGSSVFAR